MTWQETSDRARSGGQGSAGLGRTELVGRPLGSVGMCPATGLPGHTLSGLGGVPSPGPCCPLR